MNQIRTGLEKIKVGGPSRISRGIVVATKYLKKASKLVKFCDTLFKPRVIVFTSGKSKTKNLILINKIFQFIKKN